MDIIETGTIQIFSYKEGLLSKLAHDLRFTLERFRIQREGSQIQAQFWPESLRGDGVMREGQLLPDLLSAKDWRDIRNNIEKKILKTAKFPVIRFQGQVEAGELRGQLELMGRSTPIQIPLEEGLKGRLEIQPSRWGIKPFKALMGAIRVQDRVLIEFQL